MSTAASCVRSGDIAGRWLAGDAAPLVSAAFQQHTRCGRHKVGPYDVPINATVELVSRTVRRHEHLPAVAAGGCFQNRRLAERVVAPLVPAVDVKAHGEVPPDDGGIGIGQAIVADVVARARVANGPARA